MHVHSDLNLCIVCMYKAFFSMTSPSCLLRFKVSDLNIHIIWHLIFLNTAATGGPVTNETAGTKIVELSKKVRELTAELESEKNKCRQLTKKCHDLQQQVRLGF